MLTLKEIKEKIYPVLSQYGIAKAEIYGSFVRAQQNEDSDLDIIIEFDKNSTKTLFDLIAVKQRLEEVLGMEVDITTPNGISPLINDKIQKEKMPAYERR
jgi:hypothetical protein